MSLIDKIRKMLKGGEIPEELSTLYRGAKTEREALLLLKEARRRDEGRRKRAMLDLEILDQMEEELLEEGKDETGENRKLMLARRIKEIRGKMAELNGRIESIYNRRLKVFTEHITSLETVIELEAEPLPDKKVMEEMAVKARQKLEDLERATEMSEGLATSPEEAQPDDEEKAIMKEMEARADLDIEKEELEAEKPRQEAPAKEKPKAEKKSKESRKEPPAVQFED
jgi:hypothetical protein